MTTVLPPRSGPTIPTRRPPRPRRRHPNGPRPNDLRPGDRLGPALDARGRDIVAERLTVDKGTVHLTGIRRSCARCATCAGRSGRGLKTASFIPATRVPRWAATTSSSPAAGPAGLGVLHLPVNEELGATSVSGSSPPARHLRGRRRRRGLQARKGSGPRPLGGRPAAREYRGRRRPAARWPSSATIPSPSRRRCRRPQ